MPVAQPAKGRRKLYLIEGSVTFDSLELAPDTPPPPAEFADLYSARPLGPKWRPLPVVLRRSDRRGDLYEFGFGGLAVSEAAATVLKPLVGSAVEFLPLKVVGERDEETDELSMKPPKGLSKLFALRPLVHVPLAPNAEAIRYDTHTSVADYAFRPEDVADKHLFRVAGDPYLLVSDDLRKAVKGARLKGLNPDGPIEWLVAAERVPAKPRTPRPPKEVPPPPFDFEVLGSSRRTTPELWDAWAAHWNWASEAIKARGGEVLRRPKIGKPVSEARLAALLKQMGMPMPEEFAAVLTGFSGRVEFAWAADDESLEELPDALQDVLSGGGGPVIWDAGRLVEFARASAAHADSGWLAFRDGLRGRLPFLDVGNGDLIAFDLRGGVRDCPVVYLSHENEPEAHDRQLGSNFIDFMTRWSYLGCPGPDFPYMRPFYSRREKRLNPAGKSAERWRRWLTTGL